MPSAPPRPCNQPGCGALGHERFCPRHKKQRQQHYDKARAASQPWRKWYKSARWLRLRATQLSAHPLCQCADCKEGAIQVTRARVVDHIRAHKGDARLFFDPGNLQSLSKPHHDAKTAREDGRWG